MDVVGRVERLLRTSLVDRVPRDHWQPDHEFRRRRVVAAITVLVGAVLLGVSLGLPPGDDRFFWATLVLAACWVVGAVASGPLHLGHIRVGEQRLARPVVQPIVVGLVAVVVFAVGGAVVVQFPFLRGQVVEVLDHAQVGSLGIVVVITVLNGIAEELFFRGALFAAIGRHRPVLVSTLVYALATVATANVMLVFSALVLGALVGLQRRVTGGILAPVLTHITWSVSMVLVLPRVLEATG